MDFQIIVLIAFGLVSLLNALAKKRKAREAAARQAQGEGVSPDEAPEAGPMELETALDEIRQALGMGTPDADAAPRPSPAPPQAQPTPRQAQPTPRPARASPPPRSAGETTTSASDEFHRVLTGRPDSEQLFEDKKREWKSAGKWNADGSTKVAISGKSPDAAAKRFHQTEEAFRHDVADFGDPLLGHSHSDTPSVQAKGRGATTKRSLLATPDSLRRAIVVSMILGSPRSKTPYTDPRNR